MIDIPIGNALAAVEDNSFEICSGCVFQADMIRTDRTKSLCTCRDIACNAENRKDGKNVIIKLVDYSKYNTEKDTTCTTATN